MFVVRKKSPSLSISQDGHARKRAPPFLWPLCRAPPRDTAALLRRALRNFVPQGFPFTGEKWYTWFRRIHLGAKMGGEVPGIAGTTLFPAGPVGWQRAWRYLRARVPRRGVGQCEAPPLGELVEACRERAVRSPGRTWERREALCALVQETLAARLPAGSVLPVERVLDAMIGYGPLGPLLAEPAVSEVMVVGARSVYVERSGVLVSVGVCFGSEAELLQLMTRLVGQAGRRLDCASPYVDAQLPDGTRLHAIIPPLAVSGPALTLRKAPGAGLGLADLVAGGTLSPEMEAFLQICVRAGVNLLISGPCGSGKTTLLRAVARGFGPQERVVSIEDAAELGLGGHVVALQCRPPGVEGQGAVSQRDLLRNALRMRPDRLVVGEVRGGEALDLLHAMSIGHACASTLHAASAQDALGRLESLALFAGDGLPLRAVRDLLGRAVEVVVQQERLPDGVRRAVEIALVHAGPEGPVAEPLFIWDPLGGFRLRPPLGLPPGLGRKLQRSGLPLPFGRAVGEEGP